MLVGVIFLNPNGQRHKFGPVNGRGGGRFRNTFEPSNLSALKIHTFQYKGELFSVEFQSVPLKFHTT